MMKKTGNKFLDEPQLIDRPKTVLRSEMVAANVPERLEILLELKKHYGIKEFNEEGWMMLCIRMINDFVPAAQYKKKVGIQKGDILKEVKIASCYTYCLKKGIKGKNILEYMKSKGLIDDSESLGNIRQKKSRIINKSEERTEESFWKPIMYHLAKESNMDVEDLLCSWWEEGFNK